MNVPDLLRGMIETVRLLAESVDLTDTIIHSDQGGILRKMDKEDI